MRSLLPAARVEDAITALGWDLAAFQERYAAHEQTDAPRGAAPPLPASDAAAAVRRRLNTQQAAKRLGVDEKTVRRYVGRGLLSAWVSASSRPQGRRYQFDERQLAAFQAAHWSLLAADQAEASSQPPQQGDAA